MRCPRCKVLLGRVEYEGVPIRQCGDCGGVWLREPAMRRILRSRELQWPEPVRQKFMDMADVSHSPHELTCTSCGKVLLKRQFYDWDDIILDHCPGCHGIWFDPGELEKVQIYWEYAQDHPELWDWDKVERKALVELQLTQRKHELEEIRDNPADLRRLHSRDASADLLSALFGWLSRR